MKGKPFFNFVWRPAKTDWRAYWGQTATNYQKRIDKAKADRFTPTQVESYLTKGKTRYAVIFKKISGAWRARHGLTVSQHQTVFEKAKEDGFRPINVSVVSISGKRRYTVLYRKSSLGSWSLKSKLGETAYQKAVTDNKRAGRKPFYICAYMHNGKPNFSAIFAQKPKGGWRARHGLTAAGYQLQWNNAINDGLMTRVVTGYDGAKRNHRYAAMWRR